MINTLDKAFKQAEEKKNYHKSRSLNNKSHQKHYYKWMKILEELNDYLSYEARAGHIDVNIRIRDGEKFVLWSKELGTICVYDVGSGKVESKFDEIPDNVNTFDEILDILIFKHSRPTLPCGIR